MLCLQPFRSQLQVLFHPHLVTFPHTPWVLGKPDQLQTLQAHLKTTPGNTHMSGVAHGGPELKDSESQVWLQ